MENWINLFETCIILFMFVLMFIVVTIMMRHINIYRNNDSAYKRLQIRHKREMEANLKIFETPVRPLVLTYQGNYQKEFLDKCQDHEFYRNRLYSSIIEHHLSDALIKNTKFEISEAFFDHTGNKKVNVTVKMAVIPKEHIEDICTE